ncbi:hypothetical protein Q2T40_02020 [Winogradskyella maritima]|nr:hypothetical protein [Winogradskyella maritima]
MGRKRSGRKVKVNSKIVTASAVVCFFFAFAEVEAQQVQNNDMLPVVTLEQAVEISKENYHS